MLSRGLKLALVALLLATGGGVVRTGAAAQPVNARVAKSKATCRGLDHGDVKGTKPTYTRKVLSKFRNHRRLCHGIWLPNPRRDLVPQGVAITGRTAWLSGFHYRKGYGERPCLLMRVDVVTGRRLAYHSTIVGRVGQRPRSYCRHGGGIVHRGRWLWVVEKNKLWLVDPAQRRNVLRAHRVWRIMSPVRGSSIVARGQRIGLVPFQSSGAPRIHWFSLGGLLRPGVLDLAARSRGRSQLGAMSSTRIPRQVQGATLDAAGRLYLARSNLSCGELVTPYGRRVAFMPGAEGIQFASHGRRLWTVSESGAWPYAGSRKPFTPALSSYEWPGLFHGKRAACRFPAY